MSSIGKDAQNFKLIKYVGKITLVISRGHDRYSHAQRKPNYQSDCGHLPVSLYAISFFICFDIADYIMYISNTQAVGNSTLEQC